MSRLLRRAALAFVVLLLAAGTVLVAALAAAVQAEPAVATTAEPSPLDIARVLWLARQHDPRKAVPGSPRSVTLSERDVELMLNHAAHGRLDGAARVRFVRGGAHLQSSLHLPANPFGRWLNLDLQLSQTAGLPTLSSVRAGAVPLPPTLAEWLLVKVAERKGVVGELRWLAGAAQRVDFSPQTTTVTYAWPADSAERMLAALVPADEVRRLQAYHGRIVEVAGRQPPGWMAPLVAFIGPLFTLAAERTAAGGDAAAENRAALTTLTLYANGRGLQTVLPAARQWPPARPLRLTLAGRDDFPLHWLVSAATAAEGTGPLSRALGVYKEMTDSRSGSGFSFNDMAVNRAGTRLGALAVSEAQRVQARLARGVTEADILPPWADLPEFMPEPEFVRRFGGVGHPPYLAMLGEIDRRVEALPVFR